jgi:aminocarboxymuconate-semialdehyde decarboxylase
LIIDSHSHVFPEAVISLLGTEPAYGVKVEGTAVSSGSHAPHQLFQALHDPAAKLAEMEAAGLEGAVFSLSPRLLSYDVDAELGDRMAEAANRGLREFAAHDPARMGWMCQVPMQAPERAAAVLAEAAAAGAVGVEVGTSADGRRLDEEEFEPFWSAADEAGLIVFIHPAYIPKISGLSDFYLRNVIGNPLETTICAERLLSAGVLDRHPNLTLLLAHGGGFFPYQAGRWRHARTVRGELADAPQDPWSYAGRFLFDTITHDGPALEYMISRVGAENVMIGTDHPYDMGDTTPVAHLREATDDQTFQLIAEENPQRLFGLGVAAG